MGGCQRCHKYLTFVWMADAIVFGIAGNNEKNRMVFRQTKVPTMNDVETNRKESSWSDKLKQCIKPQWMVERDKKRPPGKRDWRPGHLLWVMTLGSPAEIDALFAKQTDSDAVPKELTWQDRENDRQARNSANENAGNRKR